MKTDTWITINPTSYYHEACMQYGFCEKNQYLIINYSKWIIWYNDSMNKGVYQKPPRPVFVSTIYEVTLHMASELNKPTTEMEMKG